MATSDSNHSPSPSRRSLLGPAAGSATILALAGFVVLVWHGAPLRTPVSPHGGISLQLASSPASALTIIDSWKATPDPRTNTPTWSQRAFQRVARALHPDWKPPSTLYDLARNGLWFDTFLVLLYTAAFVLTGLWALSATRIPPSQAQAVIRQGGGGEDQSTRAWPKALPTIFIVVVLATAFCDLVENWLLATELDAAEWTPLHLLFDALPASWQLWLGGHAVTLARVFAMTKFILFLAAFVFVVAFAGAAWRIRRTPSRSAEEADCLPEARTTRRHAGRAGTKAWAWRFDRLVDLETAAIFRARRAAGARAVDTPVVRPMGASGEPWIGFRSADVVGLAFSGGGIRSATFNLGLLQELARLRILALIDYVATVSGGGYVAGFWSAWLARRPARRTAETFPEGSGGDESAAIRHLREFSQFLAPRWGFFEVEMWHALVAVIAGLIPALAIALSVLGFAWILWLSLSFSLACPDPWAAALVTTLLTALAMVGFEVWWQRTKGAGAPTAADRRAASVYKLASFAACGLVLVLQALVPWVYQRRVGTQWPLLLDGRLRPDAAASGFERWWYLSGIENLHGWLVSPRLFDGTIVWLTVALIFVLARLAHTARAEPWARATLAAFDRVLMRLLGLATISFGLALVWHLTVNVRVARGMALATFVSGGLFAAMRNWIGLALRRPAKARFLEALKPYVPQALAYLTIVLALMGVGSVLVEVAGSDWFRWYVAAGLMSVVLALALFIDPGSFGLHAFYRDRIARAYLGASNPRMGGLAENRRTDPHDCDDLPLDRLEDRPLHLVCCAANDLDGDPIETLSRGARSATLSKHGFAIGDDFSRPRDLTLGAAITASAAAFNSNMGSVSMRVGPAVSFLMTALNLRLGLWVRHPLASTPLPRRWPGLLFYREMIGMTAVTGLPPAPGLPMPVMRRDVHLSDGAHFENLGLYELVRRHCRYVILSDCTADPEVAFDDLGNAFRRIREDFGVDIEIDIDPLRPGPDGSSPQHVAVGTIAYSSSDRGVLVYVKPALTGDEPPDVLQYRSRNRAFPHEGTGDQFYDEAQWEAYRRLGCHAAESIFAFIDDAPPERLTADWLFVQARYAWYPTPAGLKETVLKMTARFGEIEGEIKSEQEAGILREVFPELAVLAPDRPADGRDPATADELPAPTTVADLTCLLRVTQLMEDVWLACELDWWWHHPVNLGWVNLFARWATAPTFRFWWPLLSPMFTPKFRRFLEQRFAVVYHQPARTGYARRMAPPAAGWDDPRRLRGLAETWWRTRSRQRLEWTGRTVYEYVKELPRPMGGGRVVRLQLGITACMASGTSAGWTSDDFFVPPSLWGVGIGGDMLLNVLDRLKRDPANYTACYVCVRAPERITDSDGPAASRAAVADHRTFIEQYRKAGFSQLAGAAQAAQPGGQHQRAAHDATAAARAFFAACGVPEHPGDTYLVKTL